MTEVISQPQMDDQLSQSSISSISSHSADSKNSPMIPGCPPTPDTPDDDSLVNSDEKSNPMDDLILASTRLDRSASTTFSPAKAPQLLHRAVSCPNLKYDDCREFDNFSGEWIDSKGQHVVISPWGVIRYPNNPKLRFEATFMGPNHLSVTFDKDPKRRKFVGKLNHDCELLIWSNDTKWAKKGTKHDPRFHPVGKAREDPKHRRSADKGSCLVM